VKASSLEKKLDNKNADKVAQLRQALDTGSVATVKELLTQQTTKVSMQPPDHERAPQMR